MQQERHTSPDRVGLLISPACYQTTYFMFLSNIPAKYYLYPIKPLSCAKLVS